MTFKSALDRAAVLVKSLPRETAAKILSLLETDELKTISAKTNQLNELEAESVNLARRQFIDRLATLTHNDSHASNKSPHPTPFCFLEGVSNTVRFELLRSEHPMVIASVLSFLTTDTASELLLLFESQYRVSILKRLCQIKKFDKEQIEKLSCRLQSRLDEILGTEKLSQPGYSIASKILSCTDKQTQESLLTHIENDSLIAAQQIRDDLFQFEDILNLRDSDIKVVLRFTDTSLWAPALHSASNAVKRKILDNVSERPRSILKREIRMSSGVDAITRDQARLYIVKSIHKLSSQNLIQLNRLSPLHRPKAA